MARTLQILQDIRYSLWFIPALMVTGAIVLALAAIEADTRIGEDTLARWPRLFGASADGARALLQAVGGGMITVAGLTFSVTILVLTTAASQYTPRIIRTFMGSRSTQGVLGCFVGIFCYCLVVLRVIRGTEEEFVPSVAVTLAMLLALIGVAVLVYFIHHVASSIQLSAVVSRVAEETVDRIDAEGARQNADDREENPTQALSTDCRFVLRSARTGYLRSADLDALADFAAEKRITVRLASRIGDFLVKDGVLAFIDRPPDRDLERDLNRFFSVGHYRTVEQDPGVGIQQLVDIAVRALSPGVNDTGSALLCIDYLSAILARMAHFRFGVQVRRRDGAIRVIAVRADTEEVLDTVFGQIVESARGNPRVYLGLLEALRTVAYQSGDRRHAFLVAQLQGLRRRARQELVDIHSLARFEQHARDVLDSLEQAD